MATIHCPNHRKSNCSIFHKNNKTNKTAKLAAQPKTPTVTAWLHIQSWPLFVQHIPQKFKMNKKKISFQCNGPKT